MVEMCWQLNPISRPVISDVLKCWDDPSAVVIDSVDIAMGDPAPASSVSTIDVVAQGISELTIPPQTKHFSAPTGKFRLLLFS